MRFVSTVFALTVLGVFAAVGGARADAHGDQLEHRADQARSQAAEGAATADSLAAQIAADSARIDSLEGSIGRAQTAVAALEHDLTESRAKLKKTEGALVKNAAERLFAREQLTVAQKNLADRLVSLYTSDEPDALTILLGAESVGEALDGIEMRERVLDQDHALLEDVRGIRARLIATQRRLAELRKTQTEETERIADKTAERRATHTTLVAERDSLLALRDRRQGALASVKVDQRRWTAQAAALAAEAAQVSTVAATQTPVTAVPATQTTGGRFIWPVNGPVISPFGQRWGRLHSGIDISAPAGTPIAASASGQVVFSGVMGGYGNLVVVQHEGGIATAYAHNSSNAVSVGQTVGQGQTIGFVGCTGHCFGDHVHFEVRVNGTPVDPAAYL